MFADVRIVNGVERHRPGIHAVLETAMMIGIKRIASTGSGAHGGAEDAADDHAPSATGQVADHDDGHGAERDAEPAMKPSR